MTSRNRRSFLLNVVLPLGVVLITILISSLVGEIKTTDSIILSILTGSITSLITLSFSVEQTRKMYYELNENIRDIESFLEIRSKTDRIEHPYFVKWSQGKLRSILEQNREFFLGTNRTHPHAVDTFGIEGLSYTRKNGTLQAVSVVQDYWEDDFTIEYLEQQRLLIKKKNVSIQRIFVFKKENEGQLYEQMRKQKSMGIDVRYIYSNNEYLSPQWLKEDYLIQDGILLVQIFCDTHRFEGSNNVDTEVITIDTKLVKEKEERFKRMWERATKFNR